MIELSQRTVFELLLKAFLLGVFLGALYDGVRFFKMLCGVRYGKGSEEKLPRGKKAFLFVVTFFCDVAFWLIFSLSSLILLYNVSGGVFRFSIYPMMLSGLFVYYISLGRVMLFLSSRAVILIRKAISLVAGLLRVPLLIAGRFFIFLYHLTIGKIVGKIKEDRKKRAELSRIVTECEGEEESQNAGSGYKREGRIDFGYRRRSVP